MSLLHVFLRAAHVLAPLQAGAAPAAAAPETPPPSGAAAAEATGARAPAGPALTLDEAIRQALRRSPLLADHDARIDGAEAARKAVRGNYGPKLRLEGNVIYWDDVQRLEFAGGGNVPPLPPPTTPYEAVVAGLLQGLGGGTIVREQVTTQATVQLVQPLTGLYGVHQGYQIAEGEKAVATTDRQATEKHVATEVTAAYLRVLQAQAMREAADAGVAALEARLQTVEALERGGLAGRNDVLRVQVAVAAARQDALATTNLVAQARAGLAATIGMEQPEFGPLEPVQPAEKPVPTLEAARERALEQRLELKSISTRIAQAENGVEAARSRLIPDVNLVAQYQHNTGTELQDASTLFGGAFLSWTPFEWGATWYRVDEASAGVQRAEAGASQARTQIAFQVQSAWYAHATSSEALKVAEAAVTQAEEAARLERARYEAQKATTADLLDAESELTRARMRLEAARYDRWIALARLRDAMGDGETR